MISDLRYDKLIFASYCYWNFGIQIIIVLLYSTSCFGIFIKNEDNSTRKDIQSGLIEEGDYCGHIEMDPLDKSFDVYDREVNSSGLKVIHDSEVHENFHSLQVEQACQMKLCVINFLDPDPVRKRVCYTFENQTDLTTDYFKYFYVVVVSCSCKEPFQGCNETRCEDVAFEENECARLFTERNCSECRYEHFSMNASTSFIPTNTFSTDSFVVKDGCRLDIKSTSPEDDNRPPEFSYMGSHNFVQLSYVQRPYPSLFSCLCNGDIIIPPDKIPITDDATTKMRIAIAFMIPLVVIVIIVLAYAKTLLSVKQLRSEIETEVIAKFRAGADSSSLAVFLEQSNANYISLGYAQALKQPYQSKYEIPRKSLTIDPSAELGNGNFGQVLLGKLPNPDPDSNVKEICVAVKAAKCNKSLTYFISLLDEIKILAFIGPHPNIVGLIGACTENIEQKDPLILMEFCSKGSLKNYLANNKKAFVNSFKQTCEIPVNSCGYAMILTTNTSENVPYVTIKPEYLWYLKKWAKEIAIGMEYLSSKQVVHIDLAARNILLTDSLVAKIGDFGLSRRMQAVVNYVKIGVECPLPFRSMAPESLLEHRFSVESDVWSYGITLWEIFSLGNEPYEQITNYTDLINFLKSNQRLNKPSYSSNEIYKTMLDCWAYKAEDRPTFTQIRSFFETVCDS